MAKGKRERKIAANTSAVALVALGINRAFSAINARKEKLKKAKELAGSSVRINLSASEIKKLADHIIEKSKAVYDFVASVPLEKTLDVLLQILVTFPNIKPLHNKVTSFLHHMVEILGPSVFPYLPMALNQLLLESEDFNYVQLQAVNSVTDSARVQQAAQELAWQNKPSADAKSKANTSKSDTSKKADAEGRHIEES